MQTEWEEAGWEYSNGELFASLASWLWDLWGIERKKQSLLEIAVGEACLNAGDKKSLELRTI